MSESLNGTTTDAGGKFELNLPDGRHRIRVTYLGYEQGVYQTDHSEKDVVIKLKEKYVNIDQVVVTGTGSHRRMSNSPIPVKVLTGKDLKEASVTNFQDAMTKLNPSIVFMENMNSFLILYLLSPATLALASYSMLVFLKPTFCT